MGLSFRRTQPELINFLPSIRHSIWTAHEHQPLAKAKAVWVVGQCHFHTSRKRKRVIHLRQKPPALVEACDATMQEMSSPFRNTLLIDEPEKQNQIILEVTENGTPLVIGYQRIIGKIMGN